MYRSKAPSNNKRKRETINQDKEEEVVICQTENERILEKLALIEKRVKYLENSLQQMLHQLWDEGEDIWDDTECSDDSQN